MGVRSEEGAEKYSLKISCIVLAGGKGLRLGRDKTAETIGNISLLQWVINSLSSFNCDIVIVTNIERSFPQFGSYPRLRIVTDTYPDKGPLGGIYTGLVASDSLCNLIVACDMPLLNQELLRYMMQFSPDFDLVVPRLGNMVEPLHAIYSRNCLTHIEYLLKQGSLEVRRLFDLVRVRYVDADEINRFDPRRLSFFNINTEADLERARKLFRGTILLNDKR